MMDAGCLLLLIYPAISDIRCRRFYVEPVIVIGILFVVIRGIEMPSSIMDAGIGCIPGIIFLLVSKLTHGAVGFGDVVVITCMGMLVGCECVSLICLAALLMTGLIGLVMLVIGKANRKTTLPFVPFLLVAFLLVRFYSIIY